MRANTVTWLGLLALTAAAIAGAESGTGRVTPTAVATAVFAATALKATWVGWQYMDLRSAHPGWRAGFVGGVGLLLGLLLLLGRA